MLPVEAGARQAAIRSKQGLAQGAGGASDHLALVKAFNGWSAARRGGRERGYCASNFLSSSTMMMVDGMRSQLLGELQVLPALKTCGSWVLVTLFIAVLGCLLLDCCSCYTVVLGVPFLGLVMVVQWFWGSCFWVLVIVIQLFLGDSKAADEEAASASCLKPCRECVCVMQLRGLVDTLANASMSAANGGLVRSVLACGLYPLVGRLLPLKGHQGGPRPKATIVTAKDEKVFPCCLQPYCVHYFP